MLPLRLNITFQIELLGFKLNYHWIIARPVLERSWNSNPKSPAFCSLAMGRSLQTLALPYTYSVPKGFKILDSLVTFAEKCAIQPQEMPAWDNCHWTEKTVIQNLVQIWHHIWLLHLLPPNLFVHTYIMTWYFQYVPLSLEKVVILEENSYLISTCNHRITPHI